MSEQPARPPTDETLVELEALRRELERLRFSTSHEHGILEAVLDNSPHGVIVSDAQGKLIVQNRASERIWAGSATADDVEGWGQYRAFHPDGRPFAAGDWSMARCLRDGVVAEPAEFRIQRFDGSFGVLIGSAAPIFAPDGRLEGALAVFVDITPLKDTQAALQAGEHRQRQVLDSLQDLVYGKTPDGRVVFANRAARDHFEVGGIERHSEDEASAFSTRTSVEVRAAIHRSRDGEERYFDTVESPVFDQRGEVVQIVGVARDVTERRRAERRLAAHHAVAGVLADASSVATALPRILEAICGALEWQVGSYWEIDEPSGERLLRCRAVWSAPGVQALDFELQSHTTGFAPGVGLPGNVWASGKAMWIADIDASENFPRQRTAALAGLHGAFAFPVRLGVRVLGVLEFFSRQVHAPDDELLRMVRTVGSQLGQFIERTRVQAAIAASEAAKAGILAAALDGIITIAENGRILEFNPAAEQIFGHARADVLGREMAEVLIPLRYREAHRAGMKRYLTSGTSEMLGTRLELSALRRDGSEVPVELAITAVHAGGSRFFTGYVRDISERKRTWEVQRFLLEASKELASSLDYEATLRRVARLAVPALADWCVVDVVDTDGQLRRVDAVHADPELEMLARELHTRYPADPAEERGVHHVIRTGIPELVHEYAEHQLETVARDAEHLAILRRLKLRSSIIVPLKARGRTVGAVSLIAGDSGLRYSEADLPVVEELARRAAIAVDNARLFREREELIRSLERSNADLDEFAYVTSHDLKAPLRGIASLTTWIEEDMQGRLTDQAREYLGLVRGRVDRLAALIDGVLAYSRAGRTRMPPARVDVNQLLDETIQLLGAPPHVVITCELPPLVLETERVPLQQVFLNLMSNAVKHGGRAPAPEPAQVRVGVRPDVDHWEFMVADDGPGIAPEFHERIWGMFQTLAPRDRVEGTGIGLSIVRKIVQHHGGRAWVESTAGHGATFRFTWPREYRLHAR